MDETAGRWADPEMNPTVTPAPNNTQPQQPIVVIMQAPAMAAGTRTSDADHFKKFFPKNAITGMSIAMIVAGVFSAIIQVTLIAKPYEDYYDGYFAHIGQGIWCGAFFIVTGGLGMAAAKKPTNCSVITLMVFSILSALWSIPHMTIDGIGAVDYSSRWGFDGTAVGLYSFMFILALLAGILSIVISSYTCRAVCCRRTNYGGSVMYNPGQAAVANQTIPLGNLGSDLSKVIATAQQQVNPAQQQEQQPPAYNSLAQMYAPSQAYQNVYSPPPAQMDSKNTAAQESAKEEPDADSVAGGDEYKRFY